MSHEMKKLMAIFESADQPELDGLAQQYKQLYANISRDNPVNEPYEWTGYWSGIVSKAEVEKFFSHYSVEDYQDAGQLFHEEFIDRYAAYEDINVSFADVDMDMAAQYAVDGQWPANENEPPAFAPQE